jgi:branched-chain amino acid transport system substrate-binding protein
MLYLACVAKTTFGAAPCPAMAIPLFRGVLGFRGLQKLAANVEGATLKRAIPRALHRVPTSKITWYAPHGSREEYLDRADKRVHLVRQGMRMDSILPAQAPQSGLSFLRRRDVLLAGAALPLAWPGGVLAQEGGPIRIAQSLPLTGPLADLGQAVHQGAKSCFDRVNATGGIEGRQIELIAKDDAYDLERAKANFKDFLAMPQLLAFFNCFGTPMAEALLPMAAIDGVPVIAPYTGAASVRIKPSRQVVHIRASYSDEIHKIVEHLSTVGTTRLTVAYQNNAFGKDAAAAATTACARLNIKPMGMGAVENDASNAVAVAQQLMAPEPECVVVALAGKPALEFIRAAKKHRRGITIYAISVFGAAGTTEALGADAKGIAVSQVVPLPSRTVLPVVRDFHAAWKAAGVTQPVSHPALEGYICARALVEALKRAGKSVNRTSLVDAVWRLKALDLGGMELRFDDPAHNASRYVELTMIGPDGRFIK